MTRHFFAKTTEAARHQRFRLSSTPKESCKSYKRKTLQCASFCYFKIRLLFVGEVNEWLHIIYGRPPELSCLLQCPLSILFNRNNNSLLNAFFSGTEKQQLNNAVGVLFCNGNPSIVYRRRRRRQGNHSKIMTSLAVVVETVKKFYR